MILIILVIGRFFEGRTQVVTAQPRRTISTNVKVNPPIPFFVVIAPALTNKLDFHQSLLRFMHTILPRGGDGIKFNFASPPARRMLAAGVSRYAPDPLAALKAS